MPLVQLAPLEPNRVEATVYCSMCGDAVHVAFFATARAAVAYKVRPPRVCDRCRSEPHSDGGWADDLAIDQSQRFIRPF